MSETRAKGVVWGRWRCASLIVTGFSTYESDVVFRTVGFIVPYEEIGQSGFRVSLGVVKSTAFSSCGEAWSFGPDKPISRTDATATIDH